MKQTRPLHLLSEVQIQTELREITERAADLYAELAQRAEEPDRTVPVIRSAYSKYLDKGVQKVVPAGSPDTFRQNLYKFARRHGYFAKAYLHNGGVRFELSTQPVKPLPGAPARGSKSHKKVF